MKRLFTLTLVAITFSFAGHAQQNFTATSFYKDRQSKPGITLLSNPVTNGTIHLNINNNNPVKYQISVFSATGKKLTSVLYDHMNGQSTVDVNLPAGTQRGLYYVTIMGKDGSNQSIKTLVD